MPGKTGPDAGAPGTGPPAGDRQAFDTSVAHSARVHDYWLGGKDNFAADRAAGDAVIAAYPGIVESVRQPGLPGPGGALPGGRGRDTAAEQMAEAARRYNRLARETQRHRSHAEVARFFDGLDLVEPGLVPVQQWRPGTQAEANARSAMWGGVARKG